jgi:putative tryptophan/tyrosine transport system substrate-binding protein
MLDTKRREFIALLSAGGLLVAVKVRRGGAQQAMPVVGYLSSRSSAESAIVVDAFREGLKETGYVEGQNVAIEFRWAEGQYDRLTPLAVDLVDRRLAAIVAIGPPAAATARATTATIPIVFQTAGDPVEEGLVANQAVT